MHPLHPDWLRTLNILLYLNKDWKNEYDGRLIIKASRTTSPGDPSAVQPRSVMLTDAHTYHGFKKMSLPPGVTRKSIATTPTRWSPGSQTARTTGWAPEKGNVLKNSLARHYDTSVKAKTKIFGSATAKNR